jgi:hypothetical protein
MARILGMQQHMDETDRIGSIVIRRRLAYAMGARRFLVIIDGRKFGHLRNGQEKEFFVEEGTHTVSIKMDQAVTDPLEVEVFANGKTNLFCAPANALRFFFDFQLWFNPKDWIFIRPASDGP